MKHCGGCNTEKDESEFNKNRSKKDGLATQCRECTKRRNREYMRECRKREDFREREREHRQTDEHREWERGYNREYNQREDVKERKRERRQTEKHREWKREWKREYLQRPEQRYKETARQKLQNAVYSGKIIRPDTCSACGRKPEPNYAGQSEIHAHHEDYSKPFDVVWICRQCHTDLHHSGDIDDE